MARLRAFSHRPIHSPLSFRRQQGIDRQSGPCRNRSLYDRTPRDLGFQAAGLRLSTLGLLAEIRFFSQGDTTQAGKTVLQQAHFVVSIHKFGLALGQFHDVASR